MLHDKHSFGSTAGLEPAGRLRPGDRLRCSGGGGEDQEAAEQHQLHHGVQAPIQNRARQDHPSSYTGVS